jgi:Fur family ferric uptake transcriptional regulator
MQMGAAHHDHLICTACGKVVRFRHEELERILAEVAEVSGFEAITRQIKIFGTCGEQEACREMRQAYRSN